MKSILIIAILALLGSGCSKDFTDHWNYQPPPDLNDGLEVSTLEAVNMDPAMIAKAVGRIKQDKYKEVHAMLICKDNKLVFEEYYSGHVYKWELQFPNGVDGNGLMITPRGMAKVGALYENDGWWQGEQVLPASWVERSATEFTGNDRINAPGEASGKLGYS